MKWLERRVTDKDDREARQIEKKFGLVGYAIWEKLQQIIAENMDATNYNEWGFVSEEQTMGTLAEKIRCTPEQFRDFVAFCDEQLILEKKNGRMYCQYVVDRMNEYARKIVKKEASIQGEKSGKAVVKDIPEKQKVEVSGKSVISENPRNNTVQHNTTQHRTTQRLDSGDSRPEKKPDKPGGLTGIGSLLDKQKQMLADRGKNPAPVSGISKEWQERAFRYAKDLGIELKDGDKGRWLKIFKQAAEGRKSGNIQIAYSQCRDYPGWEEMANTHRMNTYMHFYENGAREFT